MIDHTVTVLAFTSPRTAEVRYRSTCDCGMAGWWVLDRQVAESQGDAHLAYSEEVRVMSDLVEWKGRWWRVEYGPGCSQCEYTPGAYYDHARSCRSDFCVGNGDEHSCLGDWLPCPTCGLMEPYVYRRQEPAAQAIVDREEGRGT